MKSHRRTFAVAGALALAGALFLAASVSRAAAPVAAPAAAPGAAHPGQFVWFDLLATDPATVGPFYAQLFGWTYVPQKGVRESPYSLIVAGGKPIGGIVDVSARKAEVPASVWLGYVSVTDVDRAAAEVAKRGGKVLKGPLDLGKRARAAVVTDPAGALVGLARIASGDPAEEATTVPGRFLWTEYVAENPYAAIGFYRDTFGYEATRLDAAANASYWVLKTNGVSRAGLFASPWPKVRSNWLPYVLVADAAAAAEKVRALGGQVLLEPRPEVRGGTLAIVADPSGAALALQKWPIPENGK